MQPSEIVDWALAHGFQQTGANAYSAMHLGAEYQMVLRRNLFHFQRLHPGGSVNHARCDYDSLRIDEHGMLRNAGLGEAFVRRMWHDGWPPPVWFTPEFARYALETMIPEWEAKIAAYRPR